MNTEKLEMRQYMHDVLLLLKYEVAYRKLTFVDLYKNITVILNQRIGNVIEYS